ncbi:transposase [Streptomyces sp. NBC_00237]|nr:transposase [Streptomyces sp. NBC_00237]
MTPRDGSPSDLSDVRWALIEPVLPAWRTRHRKDALDLGRPPEHDLRSLMNTALHPDRTGTP